MFFLLILLASICFIIGFEAISSRLLFLWERLQSTPEGLEANLRSPKPTKPVSPCENTVWLKSWGSGGSRGLQDCTTAADVVPGIELGSVMYLNYWYNLPSPSSTLIKSLFRSNSLFDTYLSVHLSAKWKTLLTKRWKSGFQQALRS